MSDLGRRLRALDLNLLPILYELLKTHSVSRSAEHLFLTQSAVSEALKRIRLQFKDEILVRSGRDMVPTRFASDLLVSLEEALASVEKVTAVHDVALEDIEREFVIATADSAVLIMAHGLTNDLLQRAPNVRIQFVNLHDFDLLRLERGDLDFFILPGETIEGLGNRTQRMRLYEDDFVCIAPSHRKDIGKSITASQLEKLPQVAFRPDEKSDFRIRAEGNNPSFLIPELTLLPYMVSKGSMVALVQRHVAECYAGSLDIRIVELKPAPEPVAVYAYWAAVHDNDPVHRAFRSLLADLVGEG